MPQNHKIYDWMSFPKIGLAHAPDLPISVNSGQIPSLGLQDLQPFVRWKIMFGEPWLK